MNNPLYQRPSPGSEIGKGSIVNYVSEKGNVLSKEPPWSPTGLMLVRYHMKDFQKSAGQHLGRKLVIYIKQGDGEPVT